ncbi:MAG: hypothetical protein CSA55_04910 [Ilumatobacter coccineus]|uniref:Aminoglycoside phosphotransferase domain-containing protein n=1 Tax=Ilumatobacter coccineus TaxID=467094 RepID=A0A2G6K7W8_9ACTN|nr:MAG: hypothetical protein CSA55_04910 [Ilumatobacter coccineus]
MIDSRPYVDTPVIDLDVADRAATSAARQWGLPAPQRLRAGMNVLYRAGSVVIRVGYPTSSPSAGQRLATALATNGIPVVMPVIGLAGQWEGFGVSGWEAVDRSDHLIDWEQVGESVRHLHQLSADVIPDDYPVPSPTVLPWWDFDARLAEVADEIDSAARAGMDAAVARHAGWRDQVAHGAVICHGDIHPGNVVADGTVSRIGDWDLMCVAAPGWDHSFLLTYADRWGGDPDVYRAFASGYGRSFVDDPLAIGLAELRNLAATLMRIIAGRASATAAAEARRRLRYWRGDPDAPAWRAS